LKHRHIHLLLVDNEDSYTWNLVRLFEELDAIVTVKHPSAIDISALATYDGMVISPGPGLPDEIPGLMKIVANACGKIPVLGVCLGHQAIAMHFGAKLFRMKNIIHGRKAEINMLNIENGLFAGLPENIHAGLYHSWAIEPESLPASLLVTATSEVGIIMAFRHSQLPVFGVQFHPESYMTSIGTKIAENWISLLKADW
jgi:anthranilate synthase/aminodeoxychorismate synthase-like glutamine amidotransferase